MSGDVRVIEVTQAGPQVVYVGPDSTPIPIYVPGTASVGGVPALVQWFAGDGPPPNFIPGARRGAMYVDELNGKLYQL